MRFRFFPLAAALVIFSGCGYVHFGRQPQLTTGVGGDAATAEAYSSLMTEHKILKQELALARREGDALRTAAEHGSTAASPELAKQLSDTARELATLRASHAQLQAGKSDASAGGSGLDEATAARLAGLEEKLASSLRNYTDLQAENTRLRAELDRAKNENSTLAERLKATSSEKEQAQATVAQLNTELLAQKEARAHAEQASAATKAQLTAVIAHRGEPATAALDAAKESSAVSAEVLHVPAVRTDESPATIELHTNTGRGAGSVETLASRETSGAPRRVHVVQPGDTLEKIAEKYYGTPQRWTRIYAANNDLLRDGKPLKPGMELEVP
jgi:nucleoid-associated protein YgaU